MTITISGGTGLIGRRLLKNFVAAGYAVRVLSRRSDVGLPEGVTVFPWDAAQSSPPEESLRGCDVVVRLAGEPVAQRWTPGAKERIRESRVVGTRRLVEALARMGKSPQALVCASAVGYYGSRGDEVLRESAEPSNTWLSQVCVAWEREAEAASALGMRVVCVRTGIVLDPRGGALEKMLPAFRMGAGGRLGSGKQWMPWIHLADLASLFQFAVETPVKGAMNGVAPYPVTNAEFTRELAKALHKPALVPVPRFALKLLFGEMSDVLFASLRVVPAVAEAAGFRFRYPHLTPALENLLGG